MDGREREPERQRTHRPKVGPQRAGGDGAGPETSARDAGPPATSGAALAIGHQPRPDIPGQVLGLQSAAGNRAVATALSVQRRPSAPAGQAAPGRVRGQALEQRMTQAGDSSARMDRQLTNAIAVGIGQVDAMLRDLGAVADEYAKAYQSYEAVLAAGKAHAKAMDAMSDAVIGVLIGVGVGLSLGAAFPATAGARLAMNTAIEVRNGVSEVLVGKALDMVTAPRDQAASAEGLAAFEQAHPAMQRLRAYQQAAQLYRELAVLGTRAQRLGDINALAAGLRADCRELALSGRHRSLTETQIESRVQLVERDVTAREGVRAAIEKASTAIDDARVAASLARDDADPRKMEHDIWVHWMASLSGEEAEILGSDPIEERLASLGIMAKRGMTNARQYGWQSTIGWGVGAWHGGDDSQEGVRLAGKGSKALRMVGQTGTYRKHDEGSGRFTDSTGKQWSAAPQSNKRGSWDLEDQTVVVTRADPGGVLLWVDLPAGAAEDRRSLYTARQLPGKTVTFTAIRESVWSNGSMRYSGRASSPDFPGRTWPAEISPWYAGRPAEGAALVVMHETDGTLICRPADQPR